VKISFQVLGTSSYWIVVKRLIAVEAGQSPKPITPLDVPTHLLLAAPPDDLRHILSAF
jgi:hypothetical protein